MVLGLWLIAALPAIPGLTLHYVGSMHPHDGYPVCALHNATGELRWYKLFASGNGFVVHSYYMTTGCAVSLQEQIYSYQHPVDLWQDGGYPTLVLSQAFDGRVYFLQKNDLYLFMTVIDENLQISTVLTNNPALSFEPDPLFSRTFCFLSPQLMILSSQGSVFLLNLQTATCNYYWTFPNADGFITFSRLDEERVVITSSVGWPDYANYLLNYQTLARTQITSIYDWPLAPLSEDFGDNTFLCAQSYYLDWTLWVWTLLMRINASGFASLYNLYYGGTQDGFDYTPMHTFQDVNLLGDNRFLAICTDYGQLPYNQRLGLWQIIGNSVAYDYGWPELTALDNPARLYKLQDGYYLSYHNNSAVPEAVRLLDLQAQAISLPDSNRITGPANIVSTGNNAFYAVYPGSYVHVYALVEPSATEDAVQTPPAALCLSLSPNPFRESLSISLPGKETTSPSIRVYDLRGRLVRELGTAPNGGPVWQWDGKNERGARLPCGVYLVRVEAGGRSVVGRAVLLD